MSIGSREPISQDEQRTAWRRLRGALRPRANASQVIVALLCFALGLTFAVQVQHHGDDGLSGASQQELVRLLDESNRHVSDLERENGDLDRTIETLRGTRDDDAAAHEAAQKRLDDLEILAGIAPAVGRGVEISVSAGRGEVRSSTLLAVIQELRNAGAEVIQVGQVRVVTSTSVALGDDGDLQVDGQRVSMPLTVRAIGDPDVLDPALRIPGGAVDSLRADGASVQINEREDVSIDAVAELPDPQYAEVVK
ncbi:DUF881 domain-containing protein [Brachybacterium timonense]|uniref:DUF881 domain-containing protein n=1 Tax=Brachybacterium timonense TaxID=2050896 RepID=UPI000D0AF6B5|nr:DUF881 domain-containing protein [Brachybacterium timonense]